MKPSRPEPRSHTVSRWPHRLAWALACTTFPLIWVGGLVTTYGAGMAVPDWPSTYGYWLYYPIKSWLAVWDIFLEHGHRTIAVLAGIITIGLAAALWKLDSRRWMRWLGLLALVGVCFQGTLGGLRVIANEIWLADVHGCTAPLFFAFAAALVTLTSRAWLQPGGGNQHPAARRLQRLALAATLLIYLQIVLGAQLRHLAPDARVGWFQLWVWLHLINAGLITGSVVWLLVDALRRFGGQRRIVRRTVFLAVLFFAQLLLGAATWVTNYGWPAWFINYFWSVEYTVVEIGRLQATVTTAHVAVGSLNLAVSLSLTLWSRRVWSKVDKLQATRAKTS